MVLFSAFDGRLGLTESRGLAHVSWASRPAARALRRVLRLPSGSAGSELTLEYSDHDVSDTWTRKVGRRSVVSRCWIDDTCLIEQFGPLGFVSEVRFMGRGVSVTQQRVEFYGFKLPSRICPTLRTRTWRTADGTLVSATTLRGPSGQLLCRSASAMKSVAASASKPSNVTRMPTPDGSVPTESRRELRLVS
jgi:Domain of unknown function (DUF4166)